MRYWTESTVVRAPWSIAGPSPVCFLIAVLMMPSAARSETLVDAYYASVKASTPSNPFPPHTLSAGYRDGIQSRPAQSDAESYRMGYAQANRILDRQVSPNLYQNSATGDAASAANPRTLPTGRSLDRERQSQSQFSYTSGHWAVVGCSSGQCRRVWVPAAAPRLVAAAPLPGQHSHRCSTCSYVWSHYPGQSHTCPSCGQGGNYARYGGTVQQSSGPLRRLFGR
jgi:hypothetical protein